MSSLRQNVFWIPACVALFFACEPNLDALTAEFGAGGAPSADGGATASSGGKASGGKVGMGGGVDEAGQAGESPGGAGGALGAGGVLGVGGTLVGGEAGSGGSAIITDPCTDSVREPGESDVDCGGTSLCARCSLSATCTLNSDCSSNFCSNGHCTAPSCVDRVQNQDETAIDCGGVCATLYPCEIGKGCKVSEDCASDYCSGSKVCADHCISKRVDADETDVDCGGSSCVPCADGKACTVNTDCVNTNCKNKICVGPNCSDGIKNQDETEKDCGGVCRTINTCVIGDRCVVGGDCNTYVCTSGHCAADITIPAGDMIDDFEDGNLVIINVNGRAGNWFPFGDGTGTSVLESTPLSPKRAGSTTALHYSGSGFKTWGSGIGFDFNNTGVDDTTKNPWDASAYSGITFWAKATTSTTFNFQLPDRNTQKRGGVCTTCDHHWQAAVTVGTDWERHTVRFTDLQLEPGTVPTPTAFDKTGIIMTQIFFSAGKTFEMWIDDIALVK